MRKKSVVSLSERDVVEALIGYPRGVDAATLSTLMPVDCSIGRWSKDLTSILVTLERRGVIDHEAGWVVLTGSLAPGEEWAPAGWHRIKLAILDRLADGEPLSLDQMAKWATSAFSLGQDHDSEKRLKNRLSQWLFKEVHADYGDVDVVGGTYAALTYAARNRARGD